MFRTIAAGCNGPEHGDGRRRMSVFEGVAR
jgi:hypothetical protein